MKSSLSHPTLGALLVASLLFPCLPRASNGAPSLAPNIVFIIADDLGWADVAFHGGNVPTPNLDRLRAEGMELRQHYVAPVCSPTRAGLLTGRYWSRFGITTPINTRGLPFGTATIASVLRESRPNYETCLIGKWHLGSKPEWGPNHFGFDHSYGSLAGGVAPWNHHYKKGDYSVTWHRNGKLITEEGHVTDLMTREATEWIAERGEDRPFFLYLPFTAVHLPIREPDEWLAKVAESFAEKSEVARQYAACILHLDDAVGKIVAAVDSAGLTGNTMIVFTSDNGGSTAENNDTKYPDDRCPNGRLTGSNLPLRGKKGDVYEGGIRVPTLVRWPGIFDPGSEFEPPVHIVDWMPTLGHLAGLDPVAMTKELNWDGLNLWPALTGQAELPPRPLYSAGTRFRSRVLREGDWKLIETPLNDANRKTSARIELFNLADDPNETNDLGSAMPEKVAELQGKLRAAAARDNDAVAGKKAPAR